MGEHVREVFATVIQRDPKCDVVCNLDSGVMPAQKLSNRAGELVGGLLSPTLPLGEELRTEDKVIPIKNT